MMPCFIRCRTIAAGFLLLACLGCASTGPGTAAGGQPTPRTEIEEEKVRLARLFLRLGETYRTGLSDSEAAARSYRRCLALVSTGPEADAARAGLAKLGMTGEAFLEGAREAVTPEPALVAAEGPEETVLLEAASDYYGGTVDLKEGSEGTVILYWRRMTPRILELMETVAARERSRGSGFRLLAATDDGSSLMADFLREKGIDFPLLADESGVLASRLGVEISPALSLLAPGGRLLKTVQGWDGSPAW